VVEWQSVGTFVVGLLQNKNNKTSKKIIELLVLHEEIPKCVLH
jgi:hypothetical protein